jgi:peptidoglycan/LPS O-acetylase OafA/YrhL
VRAHDEQSTKQLAHERYEALDILRGTAALMVVLCHFSSRLDLHGLFQHGYLAVDFFFALSGFVIQRVYGARLASGTLGIAAFVRIRAARLWPMVLCGTVLAAFVDIFRPGAFSRSQHLSDIVVTGLLGLLLLPTFWRTTLENTTYPLNGPVWSLFFELFANVAHAIALRRHVPRRFWILLMSISLLLLVWTSIHLQNIHVGTHRSTFVLGFPRMFWSYSLGVMLADVELRFPKLLNVWHCAAILVSALAWPELPSPLSEVFDLFFVCVLSPCIIVAAASCETPRPVVSKWIGDLSYPLYMIHYPFVRVAGVVVRRLDLSVQLNLMMAFSGTLALAIAALFVLNVYDLPARRSLRRLIGERQRQN